MRAAAWLALVLVLAVLVSGCGGGGSSSSSGSFRRLDDVRLRNQIVRLRVAYVRTPAGHARLYGMVRRYAAGVEADADAWGKAKAARLLSGLADELAPVCGECVGVLSRASARIRA